MLKNSGTTGPTPLHPAVTAGAKEKKPPCRFTMFVRLRPDAGFTFKFSDDPYSICMRGDKYDERLDKQLKYLLGVIKAHFRSYVFMQIFDNAKPAESGEKLVFKIHHCEVKKNVLTEYTELLKNFHLPEWMAHEVKD